MVDRNSRNVFERLAYALYATFLAPAIWVRENIFGHNQTTYVWYHEKFRRVLTIDECDIGDAVCFFEANQQYKRDRLVDTNILSILRCRYEYCVLHEAPDDVEKCQCVFQQYKEAEANWFTKYGDLGAYHDVKKAYMKQKHRLIWESRHVQSVVA